MNAKEKIDFVNHIYGLIIEANMHRPDEEVLPEINSTTDVYYSNGMALVRQLNTKAKAQLNKNRFTQAQELLNELFQNAGSNIESFFKGMSSEPENEKILAFFRNYQSLSEAEKKAMLMDNKVLELISKAKKNLESQQRSND